MNMASEVAKGFHRVVEQPTSGTQAITTPRRSAPVAEAIFGPISVYLGPITAKAALTACCHRLGREADQVELHDVPQILIALRPMLDTLLGGSSCRILLRRIERDLCGG